MLVSASPSGGYRPHADSDRCKARLPSQTSGCESVSGRIPSLKAGREAGRAGGPSSESPRRLDVKHPAALGVHPYSRRLERSLSVTAHRCVTRAPPSENWKVVDAYTAESAPKSQRLPQRRLGGEARQDCEGNTAARRGRRIHGECARAKGESFRPTRPSDPQLVPAAL
jgi:hypothetical protein